MPPKKVKKYQNKSGLTVADLSKLEGSYSLPKEFDDSSVQDSIQDSAQGTISSTIVDKTLEIAQDFKNAVQEDIHNYEKIFGSIRLVEFTDSYGKKIQLDSVSVVYFMITEELITRKLITLDDLDAWSRKKGSSDEKYQDGLFHNAYLKNFEEEKEHQVLDVIAKIIPPQSEKDKDQLQQRKNLFLDIANFLELNSSKQFRIVKIATKTEYLKKTGYYQNTKVADLDELIKAYSQTPGVEESEIVNEEISGDDFKRHKALPKRERRKRLEIDFVEENSALKKEKAEEPDLWDLVEDAEKKEEKARKKEDSVKKPIVKLKEFRSVNPLSKSASKANPKMGKKRADDEVSLVSTQAEILNIKNLEAFVSSEKPNLQVLSKPPINRPKPAKPWWQNPRLFTALIAAGVGSLAFLAIALEQQKSKAISNHNPLPHNPPNKPINKVRTEDLVPQKSKIELLEDELKKMKKVRSKEDLSKIVKIKGELAEEYLAKTTEPQIKVNASLALKFAKKAFDYNPASVLARQKTAYFYNEVGNFYFNEENNYLLALENFALAKELEEPVQNNRDFIINGFEIYSKNMNQALEKLNEASKSEKNEETKIKMLQAIIKHQLNAAEALTELNLITSGFLKDAEYLIKNSNFSNEIASFAKAQEILQKAFTIDSSLEIKNQLRDVKLYNRAVKPEASIDIVKKARKLYQKSEVLKIKYADKLIVEINSPRVFSNFKKAEKIYSEVVTKNPQEMNLKAKLERIKLYNEAISANYDEDPVEAMKIYPQSHALSLKKTLFLKLNMNIYENSLHNIPIKDYLVLHKNTLNKFKEILVNPHFKEVYKNEEIRSFYKEGFLLYVRNIFRRINNFNPLLHLQHLRVKERLSAVVELKSSYEDVVGKLENFVGQKINKFFKENEDHLFSGTDRFYAQSVKYLNLFQDMLVLEKDSPERSFLYGAIIAKEIEINRQIKTSFEKLSDLKRLFSRIYKHANHDLKSIVKNLNKDALDLDVFLNIAIRFKEEDFKVFDLSSKNTQKSPKVEKSQLELSDLQAKENLEKSIKSADLKVGQLLKDLNSPRIIEAFEKAEKVYREALEKNPDSEILKEKLERIELHNKAIKTVAKERAPILAKALEFYPASVALKFTQSVDNVYGFLSKNSIVDINEVIAKIEGYLDMVNKIVTNEDYKKMHDLVQNPLEVVDFFYGVIIHNAFVSNLKINPFVHLSHDNSPEDKLKKIENLQQKYIRLYDTTRSFIGDGFLYAMPFYQKSIEGFNRIREYSNALRLEIDGQFKEAESQLAALQKKYHPNECLLEPKAQLKNPKVEALKSKQENKENERIF